MTGLLVAGIILNGSIKKERMFPVKQILYRLPPRVMLCTTAQGAMRLLSRTRVMIWHYIKQGKLRSFPVVGGSIAIPLKDIAGMMGKTETQVYNIAIGYGLSIWQKFPEGR